MEYSLTSIPVLIIRISVSDRTYKKRQAEQKALELVREEQEQQEPHKIEIEKS